VSLWFSPILMKSEIFSQQPYRCRLDWGPRGVRKAAERGNILVIVDTLSFSTSVATAVHFGGLIYPCIEMKDAIDLARRIGAVAAVGRRDVPEKGRFSLSPLTYLGLEPGTRITLASPNGATCCRHGQAAPALFIGALVNARAVADAVSELLDKSNLSVTIIACGERWDESDEGDRLRVAIEDYLGAGAILSYLSYTKSPEARVCEGAFNSSLADLKEILWDSSSGRELRERGFAEDVNHSAQLNIYQSVPVMRDEFIERQGS
jgi:2-phosphosulfolactate phosphatase